MGRGPNFVAMANCLDGGSRLSQHSGIHYHQVYQRSCRMERFSACSGMGYLRILYSRFILYINWQLADSDCGTYLVHHISTAGSYPGFAFVRAECMRLVYMEAFGQRVAARKVAKSGNAVKSGKIKPARSLNWEARRYGRRLLRTGAGN